MKYLSIMKRKKDSLAWRIKFMTTDSIRIENQNGVWFEVKAGEYGNDFHVIFSESMGVLPVASNCIDIQVKKWNKKGVKEL